MISMCDCHGRDFDVNTALRCEFPIISHEGAVLETYEANGYDDSDFYAIVWSEEHQYVTTVEYASTRGWTYHNHATVDATDEVQQKALAYYRPRVANAAVARAHVEAATPKIGDTVRSTTKSGKNVGIVGKLFWTGIDKFKSNRWVTYYRAGVDVNGERHWLSLDSVELVTVPEVDEDAVRARYVNWKPANWRSAPYAIVGDILRKAG